MDTPPFTGNTVEQSRRIRVEQGIFGACWTTAQSLLAALVVQKSHFVKSHPPCNSAARFRSRSEKACGYREQFGTGNCDSRYEVHPRKDKRGVDLISDALPFGRLWYGEPNAITNAIGYAKFRSRSHDAVIRVYDEAGKVIETHEHAGEFKEW